MVRSQTTAPTEPFLMKGLFKNFASSRAMTRTLSALSCKAVALARLRAVICGCAWQNGSPLPLPLGRFRRPFWPLPPCLISRPIPTIVYVLC